MWCHSHTFAVGQTTRAPIRKGPATGRLLPNPHRSGLRAPPPTVYSKGSTALQALRASSVSFERLRA
eukprot:15443564-Alexandrium_andersonii.AAC.1